LHQWLPQAGTAALQMLRPQRGLIESPIRAEIFGVARFQQHGISLGQAHEVGAKPPRRTAFFPRIQDNIRVLREAHAYIGLQEVAGHHVSPAGEWLLDNFHVVLAQVKEIHDGLPLRYFHDLPVLAQAHLEGLPRVYGIAWAFVAHTDSAFEPELLVDFLLAYQQASELNLGELWALPTTLRVVLIENLRRLSERVAATKAARDMANLWCDEMQDRQAADVRLLLKAMAARGVVTAFALQVTQRMQSETWAPFDQGVRSLRPGALPLAETLRAVLPDRAAAQLAQQSEEAADNLSVSNAITALRLLGDADWRGLIQRTSLLMQTLQTSVVFRAERDDTQDCTLHAIERLARRSRLNERSVGQALIAQMSTPPTWPSSAPGYWLGGPGSQAFMHTLGMRERRWPSWPAWLPHWRRLVPSAYLGTIALASVGLSTWFVARAAGPGGHHALLAFLSIWPASEGVLAVFNRLISESVQPKPLPRLALSTGIPPEHRVLVVIPALLNDATTLKALVLQLERHHLANPEAHTQFALLSDFTDADEASLPTDASMLAEAIALIEELETRHAHLPAHRRFLLLHRARRWSPTESRWIGWERKRGKLAELIAWLDGAVDSPFIDLGALSTPQPQTPHVLTLDSDTVLPPGALRELVGVAAHPLNLPVVDKALRRVVAGHGILQPRIVTPMSPPAARTPYHWLLAGQGGVDPYSAVSSDVYQDVFGEGTFSGKGLLDVHAMQAVLGDHLPDGLVLSHDLIEGCVARCAALSDITLIEDDPHHADVAAARLHRWTRGDWQLLPVLLRWRRYPLGAIHRWKVLDNLRRALVEPMSVLLLVCALLASPQLTWAALALVGLALGAGPLMGAVAGLVPHRDDLAWRHFMRGALNDLQRALAGLVWRLAMLWAQAGLLVDAMARATYRMVWSHHHLLQWSTTASTSAKQAHAMRRRQLEQDPIVLSAIVLATVLLALGTPTPGLAVLLCAAWGAAPLWRQLASRHWARDTPHPLSPADHDYLLAVARDTWRLFEQHVGPDSQHLPPDNVQTLPYTMVAERTSPTNIGLYLLSTACAHQFGWLPLADALTRCEATLATLNKLERHRGHFLNWYSTRDLSPLLPAYVSTVDSGNLCGHLLAVAGACDQWAQDPAREQDGDAAPDKLQRLRALAAACRELALEAEFGFLFDRQRKLLHIGLRVAEQELDKSYYDLLASEARLASLWAIAKGDIPVNHWAALGRPFFAEGADTGLRSWSGSMFEYLMPSLVLDELPDSVLGQAGRAAIHEQMAFGRRMGLPWGMSESAYAASDHTLAYQYAPQGVPRLALRRTPPGELVVAPYASALAAMWSPQAACDNLRRLEALNARGALGFIDALDFSADRQATGEAVTTVSTYMAHHQGMTIVALAQVLLPETPRRWAMTNAYLGAVSTLLQERVPRALPGLVEPPTVPMVQNDRRERFNAVTRDMVPGDQALPPTQLMSNGRYSVALRANGAGWSRFEGVDITRWRDDALRDAHGSFLYLRRHAHLAPVSLTQHPAPDPQAHYQGTFQSDRVHLDAQWPDLRTRCTVWVSPEDDIELRQVELWNTSAQAISLELMSVFEVCLAEARADETHPAFGNLFVQAEWDAADHALYLARRPRLQTESGLHAVHFIAHADANLSVVRVQTDRARWMGRHRDATHPLAHVDSMLTPTGACVTGLDAVAALSMQLTLPAHGSARLTLGTAAGHSRAALDILVDRYRQSALIERSSLMSATFMGIRLRELRLPSDDRVAIRVLTTVMALVLSRPAQPPVAKVACNRQSLWRFGVSGDRPLLVVDISEVQGLRLMGALVQALRLWTWGGLPCDLVMLNAEAHSYLMPLQRALLALRDRYLSDVASTPAPRACSLHLLAASDLSPTERHTLTVLARVHLHADGRSLSHHVLELAEWHDEAQVRRDQENLSPLPLSAPTLPGRASRGHFTPEHGAFSFDVSARHQPPRPWLNVLANADFGAQVSETGGGYSWAGNSKLHQLTAWSNDPVSDPSGETFCLQDLQTKAVWRVGAGDALPDTVHTVTHEPGRTTIRHHHGTLWVSATWCVDAHQAIKRVRIAVHNQGERNSTVRVAGVIEWLMGALRADRQGVHTRFEALAATPSCPVRVDALMATQQDGHAGFGGHTAFMTLRREGAPDGSLMDWTCDRRELYDARGLPAWPDHLGRQTAPGLDPCAAATLTMTVPPHEARACVFVIGHADTLEAARTLAQHSATQDAAQQAREAMAQWDALLGTVTVQTPDPLFDVLVNRWLLYQTLACRMWARTGFYQAGGAFGFRDQLQDAMALAVAAPELLRAQLLLSASRQFPQGDVQHWWHGPTGAGVRTHCSDDLLWLPHATLRHVAVSGDTTVWDEMVPFIEGQGIPPDAEDAYYAPTVSTEHATLYEHCARALDHSLTHGRHGLPLMGSGDWNDGMNRVGHGGQGESVWLGWFLCLLVQDFAPVALQRGDTARAASWQAAAQQWREALRSTAWDGEWFTRAYFDDGSPLGAQRNAECRIDLIAQAWAVLSGTATPAQQQQAMASARRWLMDNEHSLLRLLDPPFVGGQPSAGYIQAYPPGVRENGGQYSHAGVWALMAQAALGDADGAYRSFTWLSPAHRSADARHGPTYGLEPYVMAGDTCTQPPYIGRGGWSWYTGSAAWMHRAAIESICGLQVHGERARLSPQLPSHWPRISLTLRRAGEVHVFTVCAAWADGDIQQAQAEGALPLLPGQWMDLTEASGGHHHLLIGKAWPHDAAS
jgi:cyclic beta-1,2-glucan synthetase